MYRAPLTGPLIGTSNDWFDGTLTLLTPVMIKVLFGGKRSPSGLVFPIQMAMSCRRSGQQSLRFWRRTKSTKTSLPMSTPHHSFEYWPHWDHGRPEGLSQNTLVLMGACLSNSVPSWYAVRPTRSTNVDGVGGAGGKFVTAVSKIATILKIMQGFPFPSPSEKIYTL